MQTQSAYNLKYENCRRNPSATVISTTAKSVSDNVSDIVDADYVDKNIPKMELLKINYVNKSLSNLTVLGNDPCQVEPRPQLREKRRHQNNPAPRPRSEGALKISELAKLSNASSSLAASAATSHRPVSATPVTPTQHHHPLKYAVYKKHNEPSSSGASKLQYTNNEDFFKSKKKYLVFDSKKRSGFDNIQFYFDNKSYERHVDNKIYGILSGCDGVHQAASDSASTGSSHSWNFIKAPKQVPSSANGQKKTAEHKMSNKKVPSKSEMKREASLIDLSRIANNFRSNRSASSNNILDTRPIGPGPGSAGDSAASLKKVKKLETQNGENRCICPHKPKSKSRGDVTQIKVNERPRSVHATTNSDQKPQRFHVTAGVEKSIVNIEYGEKSVPQHQHQPSADRNTCGYKNCTFANCPMSAASSTTDESAAENNSNNNNSHCSVENVARKKAMHRISITKIDTISNKSKLYLKTKDFNDDDNVADEDPMDMSSVTLNNLRNLELNGNGGSSIDGSTIPIKFIPNNQNLNNSIKCKSVEKPNFISTTTSIEYRKFNNLSSNTSTPISIQPLSTPCNKNSDTNRVKIFIRNPPSLSSDASSRASSSSDSCSSDYYYDRVADSSSLNATECSLADGPDHPAKLSTHLRDLFPARLGCDGAIFWNDCYYYDEHACCDCRSSDLCHNRDGAKGDVTVLCSCNGIKHKQVMQRCPDLNSHSSILKTKLTVEPRYNNDRCLSPQSHLIHQSSFQIKYELHFQLSMCSRSIGIDRPKHCLNSNRKHEMVFPFCR